MQYKTQHHLRSILTKKAEAESNQTLELQEKWETEEQVRWYFQEKQTNPEHGTFYRTTDPASETSKYHLKRLREILLDIFFKLDNTKLPFGFRWTKYKNTV